MKIERSVFVASNPAGRREIRLAIAAVLVSMAAFGIAAPFATLQLTQASAFVPAYQAALALTAFTTAVLLFGQVSFLRSPALFALAGGYLFTALIAIAYALTYPGIFSPAGLLGPGPQTTAWLFMFWHGGFPVFVIAYALLKDGGRGMAPRADVSLARDDSPVAMYAGVLAVVAVVCGLTAIATGNDERLPVLILNNRFTSTNTAVVGMLCVLSLTAFAVLWWRRPHSVLDVWLLVVMCAWLFDIALSAGVNANRFDLGWYAGRIYGLLASSFLLMVLLSESAAQYARLAQLSVKLKAANSALEQLSLHDGLTSIANRRSFDKHLADQIAAARRHKRPMALILCDIDEFKAYNDRHGHQAGDECLKQVAGALSACCRRPGDLVARYGGEEFALILPDTDSAGAARIADAALQEVSRASVRISGGMAVLQGLFEATAVQLIAAADRALYEAKQQGRNRMVCSQADPSQTRQLAASAG